jgi:hypothetical protein
MLALLDRPDEARWAELAAEFEAEAGPAPDTPEGRTERRLRIARRERSERLAFLFDKYGVDSALLHFFHGGNIQWPFFEMEDWAAVYADEVSLVLVRRTPRYLSLIERREGRLEPLGQLALSGFLADRGGPRYNRMSAAAAEKALGAEREAGEPVFTPRERGELHFRIGIGWQSRPDGGREAWQWAVYSHSRALAARPGWPLARLNLAFALLKLDPDGLAAFEGVAALERHLASRGRAALLAGRPAEIAVSEFESLIDEGEHAHKAKLGLAMGMEELGGREEAARHYRAFLDSGRGLARDRRIAADRLEALVGQPP